MTNILRVIPDAFGFNLAGAASFLDEEIDDDVDASNLAFSTRCVAAKKVTHVFS